MKKTFQLSAVAIAIAASSSVMADVIDTTVTPSFGTDALMSVTATTVNAGSQLFVAGQDVGSTLAQNTTDISTNAANIAQNTNVINQEVVDRINEIARLDGRVDQEVIDRQAGDAAITAGIAANVTTAQLNATNATVTGTLTASAVNIVNTNNAGVPNTSTSTSGISTTQKYNAGTIAGIADDVYKITEQDPSTGELTDKYFTRNAITGNYTKVELDANQKAALPYTGNKTGPTTNITTIQDVVASQSIINGQKVDFSNSKTRDTTVDIKGQLVQIDANGNPVGMPENANGQALSNQVDLEKNRAAIGILDRLDANGQPIPNSDYYGVNTVKTIYDEATKTRTSGDTIIEGDSIALTSTTMIDGTLTQTKMTSLSASGITTSRINGNGTNGALVLHGGTNSTTQTLDDNGVSFVTTDAGGNVTGTTTIDANGNLTVKGVNVTDAIAQNTTDITALDGRVATNEQNIAQNTADITALDSRVTTNEANIATNTADIVALDGRVDAVDNRVTTEVSRLDGRVDAVDNRVTTEVSRLDGRVDAVDTKVNDVNDRVTTEVGRLDGRIDTVATETLTSANGYTDNKVAAEKTARETADAQIRTDFAAADAATLTSAKDYTDVTATTLRSEAAAETTRVNKAIVDGDAATLTSAQGYTDTTATALRGEAAAETTRVNKAIADGDTATLNSAKGYTDTKAISTLASANTYTDTKATETLSAANAYTNTRVDQLNSRVDDVQKTAYRGIAIALAAQQAVPSIQPGQVAVFGGVGHYEGETAGSIGVVTAFTDRISASGAFGFAGGNEFGGRVGVAYVFGGK